MTLTPEGARAAIVQVCPEAIREINRFAAEVFLTRGGRIGSGMGGVLEALWGYHMNRQLALAGGDAAQCELAWMYSHGYNDFACVRREEVWEPESKRGELLRVEAKSMVASADESKAHFDAILPEIGPNDLILVLVWDWTETGTYGVTPRILRYFIGSALRVARVRDALHIARGGSFVQAGACPDGCAPTACSHIGEPLNEQRKRERITGPESARVSAKVSYAANFGGMVRMLKASSAQARGRLRSLRREDPEVHRFVSFIHEVFPGEEENHFSTQEWREVARRAGLPTSGLGKAELVAALRERFPEYKDLLLAIP